MKKKVQKKIKRNIREADIYVQASFNNTIFTATDRSGKVITGGESGGTVGYKNTKESSPSVAQQSAEKLVRKLKDMGVTSLRIKLKGVGVGREAILKHVGDFQVTEIRDRTPVAHNGTRLPKRRKG